MEPGTVHRPAHSILIDVAPITRRHGEAVELAVGDQVTVHFECIIEGPHKVSGEIIQPFNHNRVAVLVGKTKFSVPAESCEVTSRELWP